MRKVAVKRKFEAELRHTATGKLTLSTQQKMGTFFELRKDKAAKRRGMDSAFHQLCPRYSGTLTPTAPTVIRIHLPYECIIWSPEYQLPFLLHVFFCFIIKIEMFLFSIFNIN